MSQWYMAARTAALQGDIDFEVDTIRLALTGYSFTLDDTDTHLADVTGLLGVSHVIANVTSVANGRVQVADALFNDVSGPDHVTGLLVYKDTGDPATAPLIAHVNARADTVPIDVAPNGGDLTFSFNYLVKI